MREAAQLQNTAAVPAIVIRVTTQVTALLKRGALVTAANWELVIIQFVAESAFKALLLVPVIGAAFLFALLVGGALQDLLVPDLRETLTLVVEALSGHPLALASYLTGVLVIVVGGSILMFTVKAGTVAVLVDAERRAPAVEEPPLRNAVVRRAARFTLDAYLAGVDRYAARFIRLGLALLTAYGVVGAAYLGAVTVAYRAAATAGPGQAALFAAALSALFAVAITVVNLLYLLAQVAVVAHDCNVGRALAAVAALLGRDGVLLGTMFLLVLGLVLLATVASILATALLGFVGFVPIIGVAVLPLQLLAWLGRGLLFEFIGLAALTAYACVDRGGAGQSRRGDARGPRLTRAV